LEEFVVFLAMDDHERIIEEAETQLLKQQESSYSKE